MYVFMYVYVTFLPHSCHIPTTWYYLDNDLFKKASQLTDLC